MSRASLSFFSFFLTLPPSPDDADLAELDLLLGVSSATSGEVDLSTALASADFPRFEADDPDVGVSSLLTTGPGNEGGKPLISGTIGGTMTMLEDSLGCGGELDSAFATVAGDGASINDKIGSVGLLPPEIANERLEASDMLYFKYG